MRLRALAILVGALASGAIDVAWAGQGTLRDARGDAKPAWDGLAIRIGNGPSTLRLRMTYAGRLRPMHTSLGLLANIDLDTGAPNSSTYMPDFTVDMLRGSTSTPNRLQLHRNNKRVPCKGLRVRVRLEPGVLDFSVPQRCLGSRAGRVRITAFTYSPRGAPDEADYLDAWSAWVHRG